MRSWAGQAAHSIARAVALLVAGGAQVAVTAAGVATVLAGLLGWRLAHGPLDVAWVGRAIEEAAARGAPALRIGDARLAWDGWRAGADAALELRLGDAAALRADGSSAATVRLAALSISPAVLLSGSPAPRTFDVDGLRLRVLRDADGATRLDLGALGAPEAAGGGGQATAEPDGRERIARVLDEMARPPHADDGRAAPTWGQMRRMRLRDAVVDVVDGQVGADWSVRSAQIDLRRREAGGVEGEGSAQVVIADQTLELNLQAAPAGDGQGSDMRVAIARFTPAVLAPKAPALAALAALDAPLTLSAQAGIDRLLRPREAAIHLEVEAGIARIARGVMPIVEAAADIRVTPDGAVQATLLRLVTAPRPDGPRTTIRANADARRDGAGYAASVAIDLDQAGFADLPAMWPDGVGGPGTRPWVTANITGGVARNAHVEAKLTLPADLSDAELTAVSGGMDGADVTVHWLRPVPPIEHADARLTFVDPQTLDVTVLSGREAGGTHGGIIIRRGLVHLTGLADKDQFADISAELAGPLADLLALLKNPKIKLLDKRPMEMRDPGGTFDGKLSVNRLAFRNDVSIDDLQIHTTTHLADVRLGGIAAGRDIDHGSLELDAGNDGLTVKGDARVAGIATQLAVAMDFRAGPPSQVQLKVTAAATADEAQLARLGADPSGILTGPVAVQLGYQTRRDGAGEVSLHADLSRTAVTLERARVRKRAGSPATADLHASLDHDRLAAIDHVLVKGDGILVEGAADVAGGKPNVLKLQRIKLGDTTDAHGELRLPRKEGDPYGIDLDGPSLDLSGEFAHRAAPPRARSPAPPTSGAANKPGPAFTADLRFDRVIVAAGQQLSAVEGHVDHDGTLLRRARLSGRSGPDAPFQGTVEPALGGRRLSASAADLGALLRGLDVVSDVQGGRLSVQGAFNDTRADHALTGTADLTGFRVRGEAALGKILQGLTVYGMVDVLSGPGLNFDRLAGSFRYANSVVDLDDARAYSSSLGLTAKGQVDFGRETLDLTGTVVPAYFLNSLLGRIPVLGRIFSPERGGGVVAVSYGVHGPMSDPSIGVNPLSALTPGFMRGFFDIFDAPAADARRNAGPGGAQGTVGGGHN